MLLASDTASQTPMIVFATDPQPIGGQDFEGWAMQYKIAFKKVRGSYKGQEEPAYVVHADHLDRIRRLWAGGQESILFLTAVIPTPNNPRGFRQAFLDYGDGKPREYIGLWHMCGKEAAQKRDAWTFDPDAGVYYVTD